MKFKLVLFTLIFTLSGCQKSTRKMAVSPKKTPEFEFHPKPTPNDLNLSAQILFSDLAYLKNNIEVLINKSFDQYKNAGGRACTRSGRSNGENCSHFIEYKGCRLLKGFISGTHCYTFEPTDSLEKDPGSLPSNILMGSNDAVLFSKISNVNGLSAEEDGNFYLSAQLITAKDLEANSEAPKSKEYAFVYEVKSRNGFGKKSKNREEKRFEGIAKGKGSFLIAPNPAQPGKFTVQLKEGAEISIERSHLGKNKEGKTGSVFTISCTLKNSKDVGFGNFPCSLPDGTFGLECQVKDGEHSQIETFSSPSKGNFQVGGNSPNKWNCNH